MISDRAHVIFPWHVEEDRLLDEQCTSGEAIGTTMRGIGPCYRDKVGRSLAVRLGDMYRPRLPPADRADRRGEERRCSIGLRAAGATARSRQKIFEQYHGYAERLQPHVADTTAYLLDAVEAGKRVLFEGARARCWTSTTAPFPSSPAATARAWACRPARACPAGTSRRSSASSRPTPRGSAAARSPPNKTTRPANTSADRGQRIRHGHAAAAALRLVRRRGRPLYRRLSGVDALAVMLLDVLSELPELKICTAYELDGRRTTDFPSHVDDLRRVAPVYETLPGWQTGHQDVRRMEDLPANAARLSRPSEPAPRASGGGGFRRSRSRADDFAKV